MNPMPRSSSFRPAALLLALAVGGCAVGPDYQRPELQVPDAYRQMDGWKSAAPADTQLRADWWTLYGDAELNGLVERLVVSNQDLAGAEAQYRQARALVRSARASFWPTLSANTSMTRSGRGGESSTFTDSSGAVFSSGGGGGISKSYDATLGASWEVDVWGRLRRTLESQRASAEASLADLAAMRLSLQSELVQNYLQLRVMDEQKRLLDATVEAYKRSLKLTENQYRAGIVPRSDVAQARTQLRSTEAQSVDLDWQRAQLEHAIAVLIGAPPAQFAIAPREGLPALPTVPGALPSELLERRPDVASAERQVISANAQIGVAKSAWFPSLSLSANGGYRNESFADLFDLPNRFWSLGPSVALTLFDGGARSAEVQRSEAAYDQTVASYRQTVLDGFREVEDYLVQLRVMTQEAGIQQDALASSRDALRMIENQYRAGIVDYNDVVNLQATALSNERTNLTLLGSRLTASVQLIAALGGGWDLTQMQEEEGAAR